MILTFIQLTDPMTRQPFLVSVGDIVWIGAARLHGTMINLRTATEPSALWAKSLTVLESPTAIAAALADAPNVDLIRVDTEEKEGDES